MPDFPSDMTVDHLFSLYRTSGRPRYLAEVFDRTAPELLRVASHLSRDPAQAEDLLQSTFVEAIRSARRFTPGRRVLPWLSGILSNVARDARRRAQRRDEEVATPGPQPVDPAQAAQDAELDRLVDAELEHLDEPYRTVLLLHLRHYMSPTEIARVVSRSPATVRSQLARGRDRLQERLPRGYANCVLVALGSGRGIEAVRGAVVRQAYVALPGFLLVSSLSFLVAYKVGVSVAAALLSLLAATTLLDRASPPERDEIGHTRIAEPSDTEHSLAASTAQDERRTPVTSEAGTNGSTARLEVHVTHDGLALEGVGVSVGVRVRRSSGADVLFGELAERTDARGIASFEAVPPGDFRIELDRARGPEFHLPDSPRGSRGARRRVEIDLENGIELRGVVRTATGEPVAGASLWMAYRGHADLGMVVGATQDDGSFHLPGVDPEFYIAAFGPGSPPCSLEPVVGGEERIELVLEEAGAVVTGRVLDREGAAIANALVRVGRESPPFHLLSPEGGPLRTVTHDAVLDTRTDAQGWYRLEHAPSGSVEIFARARSFAGERSRTSLVPDRPTRHDIVLSTGATLSGTVRDAGVPLEGCYVMAGQRELGAPSWFTPSARTDAHGGYSIDGIRPGRIRAMLHAPGGGTAQVDLLVLRGETRRWSVDLAELASISGQIVATPIANPLPPSTSKTSTGNAFASRT